MEHTKLAIGEDATFTVSAVEEVKTGSWPDYILWAEQGASYIAPKGALDRQFAKIKLTPAQLVGHVVRLERAPNKEDAKKSWWNLSIVGKADLTKAPSKRVPAPPKAEVPAGGPPAFFDDVPLPESPDGDLITPPEIGRLLIQKRESIESAGEWAFDAAWRMVVAKVGEEKAGDEMRSVAAWAGTLYISAGQRGAI